MNAVQTAAARVRGPRIQQGQRADAHARPAVTLFEDVEPIAQASAVDADSLLRRVLAIGDVLAVTLAFASAMLIVGREFNSTALAVALAIVPINKLLGLYDRDRQLLNKTTIDEVPKLLNGAVILAFVAAGVNDLTAAGSYSARTLLVIVLLSATTMALARMFGRRLLRARVAPERCLVIGDSADCDTLRRKLALSPTVNAVVVGRASFAACSSVGRSVREEIARRGIGRLIVIPRHHHPDEVADAIGAIRSFKVKISIIPSLADTIGTSVERDRVCGIELVGVREMRMSRSSRMLKRALDLTAATGGLVIMSPLLAFAAIAVKLDSAGPVFYRQQRIGLDGHPFSMIKLRTMVDGADRQKEALLAQNESQGLFKLTDDPRVTRVGALLRKTSLDELPQLLNVLRGDMSLVGPRPLVPSEDENISGWYRRRSQITPGMTGAWQLHGPVRISLDEMAKLDYQYVANWSIWADMKILLQTVPHVLGRRSL
ncbi:MAG: sugar transferase [Solirubrobacterales bacterium]